MSVWRRFPSVRTTEQEETARRNRMKDLSDSREEREEAAAVCCHTRCLFAIMSSQPHSRKLYRMPSSSTAVGIVRLTRIYTNCKPQRCRQE